MTPVPGDAACDRPDLHRLVARYEFGALSDEERAAFETHLLDCDACFEELERGALATRVLRGQAAGFAPALRPEPAHDTPPAGARRRHPRRALRAPVLLPIAAVLIAVLGARTWIERQRDPARLATFPHQPMPSRLLRAPAMDDAARELMQAGAAHFDLGHYEAAARRFRAALERDPERAEAAYALGLSLALAGDAPAAVPHLEQAARALEGGDLERARWALANAYLKTGRTEPARHELAALAAGPGEYAAPARRLLARLPRSP